jgi:hypothetical protein
VLQVQVVFFISAVSRVLDVGSIAEGGRVVVSPGDDCG